MAPSLAGNIIRTQDVVQTFADEFIKSVNNMEPQGNETLLIALSGGPTAKHCYEELAKRDAQRQIVNWSKIEVLIGDERQVDTSNKDSNQNMVLSTLKNQFRQIKAFWPLSTNSEAQAVEEMLKERGNIDLIHLGLGKDGHTASLFPNSVGLNAPGLVTENVDPTENNQYKRFSLTFKAINKSKVKLVTVSGNEKTHAFSLLLAGVELPASKVNGSGLFWIIDPEALGENS